MSVSSFLIKRVPLLESSLTVTNYILSSFWAKSEALRKQDMPIFELVS